MRLTKSPVKRHAIALIKLEKYTPEKEKERERKEERNSKKREEEQSRAEERQRCLVLSPSFLPLSLRLSTLANVLSRWHFHFFIFVFLLFSFYIHVSSKSILATDILTSGQCLVAKLQL